LSAPDGATAQSTPFTKNCRPTTAPQALFFPNNRNAARRRFFRRAAQKKPLSVALIQAVY